ncbi:beta-1-3-galactosyl-O-glycosyl-glyco beta-1-6-N-acetylglucosaminyltransferase-like [Brachionus plicatilis]|uniref:Beta-1-3-galactosyl-O-glycosyl-glyco beta-1-6-N-acetylglucosaminyltransferase-like n=1 Tax=Brachionus plicatilis TaxID=10195 RepID=A0A3M7P784_BRAPC|nr:beta-1-3-galactosyl-O-glycosyl-glyco beta-1-6-N-acetylglucosaminyltransferase-like [Brachionus plicatilis]
MGELRHNICVFSLEDLPELTTRSEFFLNKFLLDYDPISYQCMEEWLNSKVSLYQTIVICYSVFDKSNLCSSLGQQTNKRK